MTIIRSGRAEIVSSGQDTGLATLYRVVNYYACNSCWNDVRIRFDHKDFLWCPHHAGTLRQFECTRLTTAEAVKAAIWRIPGFEIASVASSQNPESSEG